MGLYSQHECAEGHFDFITVAEGHERQAKEHQEEDDKEENISEILGEMCPSWFQRSDLGI